MRKLIIIVALVGCSADPLPVDSEQQELAQLLTQQQQRSQVQVTHREIYSRVKRGDLQATDVRGEYPEFYRTAAIVGLNIVEIEEELIAVDKWQKESERQDMARQSEINQTTLEIQRQSRSLADGMAN